MKQNLGIVPSQYRTIALHESSTHLDIDTVAPRRTGADLVKQLAKLGCAGNSLEAVLQPESHGVRLTSTT